MWNLDSVKEELLYVVDGNRHLVSEFFQSRFGPRCLLYSNLIQKNWFRNLFLTEVGNSN